MNMCPLSLHLFQSYYNVPNTKPGKSGHSGKNISNHVLSISGREGENVSLNDSRPGRGRACDMK
jgi:hypothetical protein